MNRWDHIVLEADQKELLVALVEAMRRVAKEDRRPFQMISTHSHGTELIHDGFSERRSKVYKGDVEALSRAGLLFLKAIRLGASFDVTPEGLAYYEHIKRENTERMEEVEDAITRYLNGDHFRQSYRKAFDLWMQAEGKLWGSDSEREFTTVGHLCREAIQAFATALVERHEPPEVPTDPAKDKARIEAVLRMHAEGLGNATSAFLIALHGYWCALSGLVQRQEHGAQKEGRSLIWEDARRIVFHSAIMMYEIDASLARLAQSGLAVRRGHGSDPPSPGR